MRVVLASLVRGLCALAGLVPDHLPLSWSGLGEEMLIKPAGAFLIVLFLQLRWLIRARRRRLALTLVAATDLSLVLRA
jgi:hypothetical protein